MHRRGPHDEPYGWWGPVWETPASRSLPELVSQGVLSAEIAGLLAELVTRRGSIVVAAGPSGAGKTTLLTAILDELPPDTHRVYLRGCYEPFDFLRTAEPTNTALLVNEISGHLPIYLWGPAVRRVFAAARQGFQLAATAHARSVEEFVHGLAGYPLHVSVEELKAIDLLVLLDAWPDAGDLRRVVRSVVSLSTPAPRDQIEPTVLAMWDERVGEARIDLDTAGALFARLGGEHAHLADAVDRRGASFASVSRTT